MGIRRSAVGLGLVAVVATGCRPDGGFAPPDGSPSFAIVDGTRGGNPDFFFLPPMVANPLRNPLFTREAFNPNLSPTVDICLLDAARSDDVRLTTPCRPGGYAASFTVDGTADGVRVVEERYELNWKSPRATGIYRIVVRVGARVLGLADASPSGTPSGADGFVKLTPGSTLPIKFRIESRALCDDPLGSGPCVSASLDLAQGGTVALVTDPLVAPSGVAVPPQGVQQVVTVTIQTCADLNPRVIDLPTFGSCLTITTEPALSQALSQAATIFICDYPPDVSSLPHDQQERVTLHRLAAGGQVQALPHADAACTPPSPGVIGQARGVFRALTDGRWRVAGHHLLGLLGPTPLAALDRGGGGLSFEFSDFQFALPAKLEIAAGDGQAGAPGSTLPVNPTVRVTDLAGDPVRGATVRFAGSGTAVPASAVTGVDGLASTGWTLGAHPNRLVASGRGLAGANADGPRSIYDPFMPIDHHFNPAGDPVPDPLEPVDLRTGTVEFAAVPPAVVPYGAGGYRYQVLGGAGTPAGWQLPGFDDSAFSPGTAPFGSPNPGCALNQAGISTEWPVGSRILARRTFTLTSVANLEIGIAIDNDIRVFLDGVDISNGLPANDRFLVHNGCPARDTFVLTVPNVPAGQHLLAIHGIDRGGSSYLDVEVRIVP